MRSDLKDAEFIYEPLKDPKSVRLLRILPEKIDGRVQGQLWEDASRAPYKCLSYTWGDQSETYPIQINHRVMAVGRNLLEFLERAILHYAGENLWVDAICINQSDDVDKSLQVQRMGEIYRNATDVLVWLGNQNRIEHLFDKAGDAVEGISSHDYSTFLIIKDLMDTCLTDLATHPYWKRAWIIQEMLLARKLTLLCGQATTRPSVLEKLLHRWPWNSSAGKVHLLLEEVSGRHRAMPFWLLFYQRGQELECRDPRDRIYSLLSVTRQESFKVDYSESLVDLFWRSADHFSAWQCPRLLVLLRHALGITEEMVKTAVQQGDRELEVAFPMRPARTARGVDSDAQCRPRGCVVGRARIRGFTTGSLMLCPSINNRLRAGLPSTNETRISDQAWPETFDQENVHVIVWPTTSRPGSPYSLSLNTHSFGVIPYTGKVELWFTKNGVESRLTTWNDVLRNARLCRHDNDLGEAWKLAPHFILRTSYRYPLACIDFMSSQSEDAIKNSLQLFQSQFDTCLSYTKGILSAPTSSLVRSFE